jgi:hypothetical protein
MRWQAFVNGSLTITYPRTNSQLVIDYGWLSGPQAHAATLWTDTHQLDPVADLEAWQQQVADDSGHLGTVIHLTSATAKNIVNNAKLKTYFNVEAGRRSVPRSIRSPASRRGHALRRPRRGLPSDGVGCGAHEAAHTRYLPPTRSSSRPSTRSTASRSLTRSTARSRSPRATTTRTSRWVRLRGHPRPHDQEPLPARRRGADRPDHPSRVLPVGDGRLGGGGDHHG